MRPILAITLCFLCVATASAQDEGDFLWVHLRGSAATSGLRIRLGDVAEIRALSQMTAERARRLPLGRINDVGRRFSLNRETIRRLLVQGGFDARALSLTGATTTIVQPKTVTLGGAHMARVAQTFVAGRLRGTKGMGNVTIPRTIGNIIVPQGRLRLDFLVDAAALPERLAGLIEVPCLVSVDGETYREVKVPLQVARRGQVVIMKRRVTRGRTITLADLTTEDRELSSQSRDVVLNIDRAIGRIAAIGFSKGQVVSLRGLREMPVIRKNDIVTARLEAGTLVVQALCRVQTEGAVGDTVLLTNLESNKTVQGVVVDSRTVRVTMGTDQGGKPQ